MLVKLSLVQTWFQLFHVCRVLHNKCIKSHPWCYEILEHTIIMNLWLVLFLFWWFFLHVLNLDSSIIGEYIFYLCACFHVFDFFSFDNIECLFVVHNISYHMFLLIEFELCIVARHEWQSTILFFLMFSYIYVNVKFSLN